MWEIDDNAKAWARMLRNTHKPWSARQVVDRYGNPLSCRGCTQRLPRPNQRKHTTALLSLDSGDGNMSQAKTLTPQELRRVLDHIATRPHAARNRAMLLVTHWSGMRVGEVAALRVSDVLDAQGSVRNEIRLDAEQTKPKFPQAPSDFSLARQALDVRSGFSVLSTTGSAGAARRIAVASHWAW